MEKYLSAIKNIWFPPQRSWRVKVWCWKISAYISQHPHILTIARSRTRDDSYTYLHISTTRYLHSRRYRQGNTGSGSSERLSRVSSVIIFGFVSYVSNVSISPVAATCNNDWEYRVELSELSELPRNWAVLNVSANHSIFPPHLLLQ